MRKSSNWTKKEIQIIKEYFPLLGRKKPRYHPSLMELLSTDKSYRSVEYYSRYKLNLTHDPQRDTTSENKRCGGCIKIKSLSQFYPSRTVEKTTWNKGVTSFCKRCLDRKKKEENKGRIKQERIRKRKNEERRKNKKARSQKPEARSE